MDDGRIAKATLQTEGRNMQSTMDQPARDSSGGPTLEDIGTFLVRHGLALTLA